MVWAEYLHNYMQKQERADLWRDFHDRFMQLAREEQGRAEVITNATALRRMDYVLRASCSYRKHPEGWERGKPGQGMICLLNTPPHGLWNYWDDGISENFRERVRLCVAEAGCAHPDHPKSTDPEDFWLHRLYLDLLKNDSDLLFAASEEGGMCLSVCVASATFCARLGRQALAHAENDAKSSILVSLEEAENIDEASAARFQKEVKTARLSLALGRHLRTGANQAESSPAQNEDLRNAILSKKARIAEIERTLNRPLATEHRGRPVHGGESWRPRLEQERQHLLIAVRELEAELERSSASRAQNNAHPAQSVGAAHGQSDEKSKTSKAATRTGQNIDRLRKDCGWSFDVLAEKTGIDKKLVLSHVNKGTKPHPRILKEYAQAFAKELGRQVTVTELEK